MQSGVELRAPFHYSITCLVVVFIITMALWFLMLSKNRTKRPITKAETIKSFDLEMLKRKYLKELDDIVIAVAEERKTTREAYNKMSRVIRKFVKETTGIDVLKCTLADIKLLNMPVLYELVKEYYEPEFSAHVQGDYIKSIDMTREAIKKWK